MSIHRNIPVGAPLAGALLHDELTKVDIEKMQKELDHRRLELRPKLIEEVQIARSFGDLSENFEYKAAKREKNRNDSRIRYLERMIRTAVVIEDNSAEDEVGLFDTVTVFLTDEGEEEESSFAGFGSMPLSFIDAIEDADQYAAWLEQEARGEVQLVTRYRRSFQSRLIQSQGNVQEYYNVLKNALLSYKGVKSRTSWNYEAYNRGRVHVAKMNAKTKADPSSP